MTKKNLNQSIYCSFKETLDLLPILWKTDRVPLIWGPAGVGKTQLAFQYCQEHNLELILLYISQLESSDFIGLYERKNGKVYNCHPEWLPLDEDFTEEEDELFKSKYKDLTTKISLAVSKESVDEDGKIKNNVVKELGDHINETIDKVKKTKKRGCLIFFDEVNRGKEDITQALYQFISQKRLHTYKSPDKALFLAAANPQDLGYGTSSFDPALMDRFAHIRFRPTQEEVAHHLGTKYKGIMKQNAVLSFLYSQDVVLEMDQDEEYSIPLKYTPRASEASAQIYDAVKLMYKSENKTQKMSFLRKALCSVMPEHTYIKFLDHLSNFDKINVLDILSGRFTEIDILNYLKTDAAIIFSLNKDIGTFFGVLDDYRFSKDHGKEKLDSLIKKSIKQIVDSSEENDSIIESLSEDSIDNVAKYFKCLQTTHIMFLLDQIISRKEEDQSVFVHAKRFKNPEKAGKDELLSIVCQHTGLYDSFKEPLKRYKCLLKNLI